MQTDETESNKLIVAAAEVIKVNNPISPALWLQLILKKAIEGPPPAFSPYREAKSHL